MRKNEFELFILSLADAVRDEIEYELGKISEAQKEEILEKIIEKLDEILDRT